MAYFEEFKNTIEKNDFHGFLKLWEEYCASDTVDAKEFLSVLQVAKNSDLRVSIGKCVEMSLPLWSKIEDSEQSHDVLRAIMDLQNTNSEILADTAYEHLKALYGDHKLFNQKIRLVGLRDRKKFPRVISNYELLSHMDKGCFVFHTGGWGTGEIVDISLIREDLIVEFENIAGRKDLTFENAFNTLEALSNDHFLARRFADPDELEADARENPEKIMELLLHDLGPKTAVEIKDEMAELVIPLEDWTKWWQLTRAKLKKNNKIVTPKNVKDCFYLRNGEVSLQERLDQALATKGLTGKKLQACYNLVRDLPEVLKEESLVENLKEKVSVFLDEEDLSVGCKLQIALFLQQYCSYSVEGKDIKSFALQIIDVPKELDNIDVLFFKKRALNAIKENRNDWVEVFSSLILEGPQNPIRDFVLKELNIEEHKERLTKNLIDLQNHPTKNPEAFVWYIQKVIAGDDVPLSNKEDQSRFFEEFFVLYHALENIPEQRDLLKKMYHLITGKRWAVLRKILDGSSMPFARELLLLASKCQSFSEHDMQIFRNLIQVVHPSLSEDSQKEVVDNTLWTTEKGYQKTHERIRFIGEEEIVDNAKEIEAARALGDLRENSEYKFALERRARLQAELKMLSDQIKNARILSPLDIETHCVGVGVIVYVKNSGGEQEKYTILGPWDADPDNKILSYQSRFAQEMIGKKPGESFEFKDENYQIESISSYLDAGSIAQ